MESAKLICFYNNIHTIGYVKREWEWECEWLRWRWYGDMVKAIALRFSLDKFIFGICVTVHTDNQFNSTMQLNQLKTINLYYSNVYLAMPTMTYCACTNIRLANSMALTTLSYLPKASFSKQPAHTHKLAHSHTRTLPHVEIVNNSITIRLNKHKLRQSCRKCCSTKLISPFFRIQ